MAKLSVSKKKKKEFSGTKIVRVNKNIAIGCITPEARDLLEKVMEEWEKHKINLPEKLTYDSDTWNPRESVYGFAYWLIRWSGLVQPMKETNKKEK